MKNIDVLDVITTWPTVKQSPFNVNIDGLEWEWSLQGSEWVISNHCTTYCESGWKDYTKDKEEFEQLTSIEDTQPAPHIFDVINYWPEVGAPHPGTKSLPKGWEWRWFGDDWVLSNGTIGLTRNDWEKHCDKKDAAQPLDPATAKQAAPKGSGNPILGMVLADLTNRALEGKEKYGEPLLAHNGRNPLWDAYQEALDLAMYLRQAIEESK